MEPWEVVERQMQDLNEVRKWKEVVPPGPTVRCETSWAKPPHGCVKINYDAAVNSDGSDVGLIARDKTGKVLFVGVKRVQGGAEPIISEAEAILWAMEFVRELEFSHVIIESDSLVLITKLRKKAVETGVLGTLVGHIIQAMREDTRW